MPSAPDTSFLAPPLIPSVQEERFPTASTVWHQPGTGCWRPLGSLDQRLGSFRKRVHPARGPQSEARASPRATERAGGAVGAASRASPLSNGASRSHLARSLLLFPGWGLQDRKCLRARGLPRSGPLPGGRLGRRQRGPGPSSAAPSPHPAGGWSEGPGVGRGGSRRGSRRCHWRWERGEARATHRTVAAPLGPARSAREAAQVRPRRGREFESRSRQWLRLPAAPAHCPAPRLSRTRPAADAAPGDPSPRAPSQRPAGSRGRASAAGAAAGGRREGGAGQEFFQWVETRARRWNPAIGGSAGTRGNFATRRAGARGKGDRAPLMINPAGGASAPPGR